MQQTLGPVANPRLAENLKEGFPSPSEAMEGGAFWRWEGESSLEPPCVTAHP